MAEAMTAQELHAHFAWCVQVLGGVTATSRRLGIDERALRRFISGERPLSAGLIADMAKALRALVTDANAAEAIIAAALVDMADQP